MTTKQKELMLTLYATLMDIYKETENDKEFRNFIADTFDDCSIDYPLTEMAKQNFFLY